MDTRVGIRLSSHWMGGHKARLRRKEYPLDTRMDRRAFLKNAALAGAALMVAPVALGAAEPKKALADEGTCTCNLWVKPTGAPALAIGLGNVAYMTNPNTPGNGGFPTSAVENNATYVDNGDGTWTVTIPLVNTMFTLTSYVADDSTGATIESGEMSDGHYTSLVVTMPSTSATYQFSATEHAAYALYAGDKSWPINIQLSV